ncbi:hypothetical protein LFM09_39450 [Lentzea alba]|uniref:hypothetical protein n=1 Tax=Lentzea alba TaxID=2714351 RepID=UPI0039BF96EF
MKRLLAITAITAGLLTLGAGAANAAELRLPINIGQRYSVIVEVEVPDVDELLELLG